MNNKGFTLIESIIVVIIISLICALVLPNSSKILSNIKIRSTIRQIGAVHNYARQQAVIRGTDYKVNYNLAEKSCWITKREDDTFTRLSGREGKTLFIPQEIPFETEIDSVTFFPKGISTGSVITIGDFQIVVDEVTATVEVVRGEKENTSR